MPSDLEDAAVNYVDAYLAVEEAEMGEVTELIGRREDMLHTLIVAAGYPCPMCDPGSCPLAVSGSLVGMNIQTGKAVKTPRMPLTSTSTDIEQ